MELRDKMKTINSKKTENVAATNEKGFSSNIEIDESNLFSHDLFLTSFNNYPPAKPLFNFLTEEIIQSSKITSNIKFEIDTPGLLYFQQAASSQIGTASFLETRFINTKEIRNIALSAIQKLEEEREKFKKLELELESE